MDKNSRALRIHHVKRKKAEAKKRLMHNFRWAIEFVTDRRIGMYTTTPTPCSCAMCGNARAVYGRSLSEIAGIIKLKEGLEEI